MSILAIIPAGSVLYNKKTPEGVYAGCVGVRIIVMLNGNGKLSSFFKGSILFTNHFDLG